MRSTDIACVAVTLLTLPGIKRIIYFNAHQVKKLAPKSTSQVERDPPRQNATPRSRDAYRMAQR